MTDISASNAPAHHGVFAEIQPRKQAGTAVPDTPASDTRVPNGACTQFAERRTGTAIPDTSATATHAPVRNGVCLNVGDKRAGTAVPDTSASHAPAHHGVCAKFSRENKREPLYQTPQHRTLEYTMACARNRRETSGHGRT